MKEVALTALQIPDLNTVTLISKKNGTLISKQRAISAHLVLHKHLEIGTFQFDLSFFHVFQKLYVRLAVEFSFSSLYISLRIVGDSLLKSSFFQDDNETQTNITFSLYTNKYFKCIKLQPQRMIQNKEIKSVAEFDLLVPVCSKVR